MKLGLEGLHLLSFLRAKIMQDRLPFDWYSGFLYLSISRCPTPLPPPPFKFYQSTNLASSFATSILQ